jgi:SAM-dependent methyltransferase
MTRLSETPAARSHPADAARRLIAGGTGSASPGAGPLRRFARRLLLRLMRPFSARQQMIDNRLLDAIDDLDRRLRGQERLQLDLLTEDFARALDTLRARVARGEELVAGSRALPYVADDALQELPGPSGGVVLGYRDQAAASPSPSPSPSPAPYRDFEEVFRGPEDRVRERQKAYLDLLSSHEPVLDAGCGRGEFLDLLREHEIAYTGVDVDPGMVERCRAKGHADVEEGSANEYLERLSEGTLGAVFSAQVIEHLPYADLTAFLRLSRSRLRSGGLFVAETVNPHAPHALKTFWVDPTHQHPLFPEVMLVLCRIAGFGSAYVFHPLGSGDIEQDRYRESEYAVVARAD